VSEVYVWLKRESMIKPEVRLEGVSRIALMLTPQSPMRVKSPTTPVQAQWMFAVGIVATPLRSTPAPREPNDNKVPP
jgi:hypothetical protein